MGHTFQNYLNHRAVSILLLPLRFDLCQIFSRRIVRGGEEAGMGWDLMSTSFVRFVRLRVVEYE